jgi:hypothetical protein
MASDTTQGKTEPPAARAAADGGERQRREAAALRANLAKRKAQARGRWAAGCDRAGDETEGRR